MTLRQNEWTTYWSGNSVSKVTTKSILRTQIPGHLQPHKATGAAVQHGWLNTNEVRWLSLWPSVRPHIFQKHAVPPLIKPQFYLNSWAVWPHTLPEVLHVVFCSVFFRKVKEHIYTIYNVFINWSPVLWLCACDPGPSEPHPEARSPWGLESQHPALL